MKFSAMWCFQTGGLYRRPRRGDYYGRRLSPAPLQIGEKTLLIFNIVMNFTEIFRFVKGAGYVSIKYCIGSLSGLKLGEIWFKSFGIRRGWTFAILLFWSPEKKTGLKSNWTVSLILWCCPWYKCSVLVSIQVWYISHELFQDNSYNVLAKIFYQLNVYAHKCIYGFLLYTYK